MLSDALLAALIGEHRIGIMTFFLYVYLFSAAYSPGLDKRPNPVHTGLRKFPWLASRSGASLIFRPRVPLSVLDHCIVFSLQDGGVLVLFSGLNLLSLALVFLPVEETQRASMEDLDLVFAVRKSKFIKYQLTQYLPWWFRYYVRRNKTAEQHLFTWI
ncbi:hypothetical protein PG985_001017 [Apiospora marii]|uniref:Uncharacterized protein n=1 Tax=Apiospora marii TaxID=335849 RepID=A0ABR1RH42_9PEZI